MSEFVNYGGQQVPALQITTGLYPSTATPLDIRTYVKTKSILESSNPVGCALHIGMQIYVEDTNEYVTVVGQRPNTSGAQWNHWIFDIIIPQLIASLEADKQNDPSTYAQIKSGVYTTENLINYLFIKFGGPVTPVHTVTIQFLYADETEAREPVQLTVLEGSAYSFNVYEITGYQPDRSVVSGTMVDHDVVETVTYYAIPYTLTYMVEHGGDTYVTYPNVLYNTAVEVPTTPEPPHEGVTFDRWEYVPELIGGTYMPASDVTAYGIWEEVIPDCTVSVTVVPTGSGETTGQGEYTNGDNVVLTATPTTGYEFVNWVDSDSSQVLGTETTYAIESIGRNWNINANFSPIQFTVSANVDPENSGTVEGTGSFNMGTDVTVTATASTGYTFTNWLEGGSFLSDQASYTINSIAADHELTAKFNINTYNVTLSVDPMGGGTVEGNGTYEYGTDVSLTAQSNSGYNFLGWYENGELVSSNANYTIESIDDNHEFVAKFTVSRYTISTSSYPNDGGTTTGGGDYDLNDSVTVEATESANYEFTNWTENGVEVSSQRAYTFTVTSDRSLVANFSIRTYNVTAAPHPNGAGMVIGGGVKEAGSTVVLKAEANDGYLFSYWYDNDSQSRIGTDGDPILEITNLSSDRSITAHYTERQTVTVNVYPMPNSTAGQAEVEGGSIHYVGDNVKLTATPAEGYNFGGWFNRLSASDTPISTDNPYVIENISESMQINAVFSELPSSKVYAFGMYDVDIDAAGGISSMSFEGKPSCQATETDNIYAAVIGPLAPSQLKDATRYTIAAIPEEFTYQTGNDFFKAQSMPGDAIINYGISGYRSHQPITRTIDGSRYYVVVSADIEEEDTTTLIFGNTSGLTSWSDALASAKRIQDIP